MNGHRIDSAGVCGYCDRCEDAECCPDTINECDHRIWVHLDQTWNRMVDQLLLDPGLKTADPLTVIRPSE